METDVYVRLFGEGICVYRRLPATHVAEDVYVIGGDDLYEPEEEHWEFVPGSAVIVKTQLVQGDEVLVAVGRASQR